MDDLPASETFSSHDREFYIGPVTLLSIEQLFGTDADIRSIVALADGQTYRHRLGLDGRADGVHPLDAPAIIPRLHESQAILNSVARNADADWLTTIRIGLDRDGLLDTASAVARAAFTRTQFDLEPIDTRRYVQQMRRVIDEALGKVQ